MIRCSVPDSMVKDSAASCLGDEPVGVELAEGGNVSWR